MTLREATQPHESNTWRSSPPYEAASSSCSLLITAARINELMRWRSMRLDFTGRLSVAHVVMPSLKFQARSEGRPPRLRLPTPDESETDRARAALALQFGDGGGASSCRDRHAHAVARWLACPVPSMYLNRRVPALLVPAEASGAASPNDITLQIDTCITIENRPHSSKRALDPATSALFLHTLILTLLGLLAQLHQKACRHSKWSIFLLFVGILCAHGAHGQVVTLSASMGDEFSCFIVQGHVVCCGIGDSRLGISFGPHVASRHAITPTAIFDRQLLNAHSLASGYYHSCLIHSGGLQCVGDNSNNQLGTSGSFFNPPKLPSVVTLGNGANNATLTVAGAYHSCAINVQLQLWCWGWNKHGQTGGPIEENASPKVVPNMDDVVDVACGRESTCSLFRNGSLFCFGNNDVGQLGIGRADSPGTGIVTMPSMQTVAMVRSARQHSCAIDFSGSVFCWGLNTYGNLGDNTTTSSRTPVKVQGITKAVSIACKWHQCCAIAAAHGALYCWGYNRYGQLGVGNMVDQRTAVRVKVLEGGVTAVTMALLHTCALSGNQLWCWGWNRYGAALALRSVLSVGVFRGQLAPSQMPAFAAVSANIFLPYRSISNWHLCAIISGRLKCWGYNDKGQLGISSTVSDNPSLAAQDVIGLESPVAAVACGYDHTCAIAGSLRTLFCWGLNDEGQLGEGSTTDAATPKSVRSDLNLAMSGATLIAAGRYHSCAVIGTSGLYCWGYNTDGQLGIGSSSRAVYPSSVAIPSGISVSSISCGNKHACAIYSSGVKNDLYCWGKTFSSVPTLIPNMHQVSDVSCGAEHTCAVSNASLYCWGVNENGQLGDNSTTDKLQPSPISVLVGVSKVSCGPYHTCALSASGDLFCWGWNAHGQLGTFPETPFSSTPLKVDGLGSSGVAALSLSQRYTMVLMNDGRVLGWGHLHHSGDSGRSSLSPVPIPADGLTMSSISLILSHPVVAAISSLSLRFSVGYIGARSTIRSIVVSGMANMSMPINSSAHCLNFAAGPVNVSVELSSNVQGSSVRFTLPSAMRVSNVADMVQCTVDMLVTPASPTAALPWINISIFDNSSAIVEAVSLISHPVVFLNRIAAAPLVTLSSYVALASNVTATVSFAAEAAHLPFRTITIRGMLFAPSLKETEKYSVSNSGGVVQCSNISPPSLQVTSYWSFFDEHRSLEISFPSDVTASGSGEIVCTIPGFTNGLAAPSASVVSVGTYSANGTGNVIVSGGTFPAIFYAEGRAHVNASSAACRRPFVLTISIEPVTTAAAVKLISVSGLPSFTASSSPLFAICTLQELAVNATANLGASSLSLLLASPTYVSGSSLSCRVDLLGPTLATAATSSVIFSSYVENGTPLEIKGGLSLPAFVSVVVSGLGPNRAPQTGHTAVTVFGNVYGASASQRARLGATALSSTRWISDTSVIALAAAGRSSAALNFPARISVQSLSGSRTGFFSFSTPISVTIPSAVTLPTTGGFFFIVLGKDFGSSTASPTARLFRGSLDVEMIRTSSETSAWLSSSSCATKTSRSGVDSVFIVVSYPAEPRTKSLSCCNILSPQLSSVTPFTGFVTTGNTVAIISGRSFGGISDSASVRFGGTTWPRLRWASDSAITTRSSMGVASRNSSLIFSADGTYSMTSMPLSFELPQVRSVSTRQLSSLNVTGSNFGTYNGSLPISSSCPGMLIPAASNRSVCEFSLLAPSLQAGITHAVFSLSFTSISRLDDVIFFLDFVSDGASKASTFILMANKCSCFAFSSASFEFQVLPTGLSNVPISSCAADGRYSSEAASGIIDALAAPGKWALRVGSGRIALNLLGASISFVPATLQFQIGTSFVSSMSWISDSSVTMDVPGYQTSNFSRASGGGFGRSLPVTATTNGFPSRTFANYSYPDPVITNVSATHTSLAVSHLPTTGSAHIILSGQYFSNVASSPDVRLANSGCAASIWTSDSSISCRLSSLRGNASAVALSVAYSAIASFTLAFQQKTSISSLSSGCAASSGLTAVSVFGTSFGNVGSFSVRVRILRSASPSTGWASDSAVFLRLPSGIGSSSLIVSVCDICITGSSLGNPNINILSAPIVSAAVPNVFASTGSSILLVTGMYGTASACSHLSLSGTSCAPTHWTSHSALYCKTAWGVRDRLAIVASIARLRSEAALPHFSFFAPRVSNSFSFINTSLLNTSTCFFANATVCSLPQIVGFVSNASGFGAFSNSLDIVLEGRRCSDVTWLSDSAVFCAYSHAISKSLFTLNFTFTISANDTLIRTSYVSVTNPLFVPKSPQVNTSLFSSFYWPLGDGAPSNDAIERYQRLGRASGVNIEPNRLSLPPVAEFFESVSVKVIVYINDTANSDSQIFMDSNFVPISKIIHGKFNLVNASTGANANSIFCSPPDAQNITLLPEKHAALAIFELSFCSLAQGVLLLSFNSSSNDDNGYLVNLPTDSMPLTVRPPGPASVSVALQPMSHITIGNSSSVSLFVRYDSGSSLDCSRTRFSIILTLACQFQGSQISAVTLFKLSESNERVSNLRVSVTGCSTNISSVGLVHASSLCVFKVSVPLAGVFATSAPFVVLPGAGADCRLMGPRVNCESAGALIWSMRTASNQRCLGVQLLDEEGNNASSTALSIFARARYTDTNPYALVNAANYSVDSIGIVLWCELYSTNTSEKAISVGVAVGTKVNWLAGVFNVSSPGPPAALAFAASANQSSPPLFPGQVPPSINLTITDAGGNNLVKTSKSIVIRVRIRPRVSVPRRLLLASETVVLSPCPSTTFVIIAEGSPTVIPAPFPQLCTAGQNDIFYAVGDMIGDSFVPAFNFELLTTVTVIPGPHESFTFKDSALVLTRQHDLIKHLEIEFRDKGMNVVSGSASMMLQPSNEYVQVYPSNVFYIFSNDTSPAILPPFFLSMPGLSAVPAFSTLLRLVGNVNSSVSNAIKINITATCLPGSRLFFPGGSASFQHVYQMLLSGRNVSCATCDRPLFDSWRFDARDCLTLNFINAPIFVHSGRALLISGISVVTDSGQVAAYATDWTVTIQLLRSASTGFAVNVNAALQRGQAQPTSAVAVYTDTPGSDYFWVVRLFDRESSSGAPVFHVNFARSVTVTDFSPVSLKMAPSTLAHTGHPSITLTGSFPSGVAQFTSFSSFTLPRSQNNSCFFKSTSSSRTVTLVASVFNISNSQISFVCGPLVLGDNSRTFANWSVSMLLWDGRESSESLVDSYCPTGMYIEPNATAECTVPPCCFSCPSPMSASFGVDSLGLRSCICQLGYYGSGGSSCTACPKSPKYGFNCSVPGLQFPLVKPGFYIDYSLLTKCSEESCSAVVKCPNAQACPGFGERNCLDTANECYSNRSIGCTLCCPNYYADNFVCRKCPESRLIVVLTLAIILLILVAILSSYLSFPPFVTLAKGLKLILSGLQSFSCVRLMAGLSSDSDGLLSGVNWPPIMMSAFEFMNTFTFSFDSLRPECSFEFSARTKLFLITLAPFFVVSVILLMAIAYSLWKVHRIYSFILSSNILSEKSSKMKGLFRSIAHCFSVSTFSMKYSRDNQISHGSLWPALDPTLLGRSDISVVAARSRRHSLAQSEDFFISMRSDQFKKLPQDWKKAVLDFQDAGISRDMAVSTRTTRMLVSSAFSVFVFTFQGVLETLLSTWDCKDIENRKFLRYRPNIECSVANSAIYLDMVVVSSVGLAVYVFLLPLCVMLAVRSRWAREIYAFNFPAYDHLFGFITGQYSSAFVSWEAINCMRKMLLVAIPLVITSSPIIQSLCNIMLFFIYAMVVLQCKPMVSSFLNTIEVINSCNIIVTSFAAILFTVQYQNVYIIKEDSKDVAGIALIVFIFSMFGLSVRLIYVEFIRLFTLHHNSYLSKWLSAILARCGGSILLDKYLPISLLFFNRTSSQHIQRALEANNVERQQAFLNFSTLSWFGCIEVAWTKAKLRFKSWRNASRYVVDEDLINEAMAAPDYDLFVWMHKLLQRTSEWKSRENELRRKSFVELPKMFTVNYGESDPPIAVCDALLRTSRALDEILHTDHQKLLLAFMLKNSFSDVRPNLDHGKCDQYQQRLRSMIESFKEQLQNHADASDLFSNAAEDDAREICRPLRTRLYGARESEKLKVLRRISRTTLPKFHEMQKSAAAEAEAQRQSFESIALLSSQFSAARLKRLRASPSIQDSGCDSISHEFNDVSHSKSTQEECGSVIAPEHQGIAQQNAPVYSKSKPRARQSAGAISIQNQIELEDVVVDRMYAPHERKAAEATGSNRMASAQSILHPEKRTSGNARSLRGISTVKAPASPLSWTGRVVRPAGALSVKANGAKSAPANVTSNQGSAMQARQDARQRNILRIESELASVSGASDDEASVSPDMRALPPPPPPRRLAHAPTPTGQLSPLQPHILTSASKALDASASSPLHSDTIPQPLPRTASLFAGSGNAMDVRSARAVGISDQRSAIQARQNSTPQSTIGTVSEFTLVSGASDADASVSSDMRASPPPPPPWHLAHAPSLSAPKYKRSPF